MTDHLALKSAGDHRLFHTPIGLSTRRPAAELPPLNRAALMRGAHGIAAKARPYMANYREAFAYGLAAAWRLVELERSCAALRSQVRPVTRSASQLAAGREATRRCGTSWT